MPAFQFLIYRRLKPECYEILKSILNQFTDILEKFYWCNFFFYFAWKPHLDMFRALYSGIILVSSGNHMWQQGSNQDWPYVRQGAYKLYYISGLSGVLLKKKIRPCLFLLLLHHHDFNWDPLVKETPINHLSKINSLPPCQSYQL